MVIFSGLLGLMGVIIGAAITYYVEQTPVLTLAMAPYPEGLPASIFLKNLGGMASNIKWEFKGNINGEIVSWNSGIFSTIGKGELIYLFSLEREEEKNPNIKDQLYFGEIEIKYNRIWGFGMDLKKRIKTDIYRVPLIMYSDIALTPELVHWMNECKEGEKEFQRFQKIRNEKF